MVVEVGKIKEGLYILDLLRLGPILDGLHFHFEHAKSRGWEAVSKVLGWICMEFTFLRFGKESVFAEASEHLLDMLPVESLIIRVNENIFQVDYDTNI